MSNIRDKASKFKELIKVSASIWGFPVSTLDTQTTKCNILIRCPYTFKAQGLYRSFIDRCHFLLSEHYHLSCIIWLWSVLVWIKTSKLLLLLFIVTIIDTSKLCYENKRWLSSWLCMGNNTIAIYTGLLYELPTVSRSCNESLFKSWEPKDTMVLGNSSKTRPIVGEQASQCLVFIDCPNFKLRRTLRALGFYYYY